MLCDRCKVKEAKIYYTEIVDGKKREQHLCEECAAELTSFQKEIPLDSILSSMLGWGNGSESVCTECGMSYQEFRHAGKFGCAHCYKTFDRFLQGNLKRVQGATMHTGKVAKSWSAAQNSVGQELNEESPDVQEAAKPEKEQAHRTGDVISSLEQQLKEAIVREEYEEAAHLRDQIRELRDSGEKGVDQECQQRD